jgi:hypothetical protein
MVRLIVSFSVLHERCRSYGQTATDGPWFQSAKNSLAAKELFCGKRSSKCCKHLRQRRRVADLTLAMNENLGSFVEPLL